MVPFEDLNVPCHSRCSVVVMATGTHTESHFNPTGPFEGIPFYHKRPNKGYFSDQPSPRSCEALMCGLIPGPAVLVVSNASVEPLHYSIQSVLHNSCKGVANNCMCT